MYLGDVLMRIFTREAGFNARELTDKGGRGLLLSGPCSQSWECLFVSSARLLLRSSLLVHCSQSFVHWNCFPGIATLWYCMMLCDVQLQVPLWVSQTAPGEIVVVTVEYYTFHFRSLSQSCRFSVNHCHFSSLPRSRIILACHPRAISTVTTILLLTGIV